MLLNNIVIKNLLRKESESVIFVSECLKDVIAKNVVSLLNSRNGDVLVGVNEVGKVLGVVDAEYQAEVIADYLQKHIIPDPPFTISVCQYDKKDIILISVWEGAQKPYSYDKKIFVRLGDSAIVATSSDLINLINQRKSSEFTWERRPILSSSLLDLDVSEVNLTQKETRYIGKSDEEFLQYMNLLSNNLPTNACVTLFGKEPVKYIPQVRIKLSCFEGNYKDSGIRFMQVFEGNIFNNITT